MLDQSFIFRNKELYAIRTRSPQNKLNAET